MYFNIKMDIFKNAIPFIQFHALFTKFSDLNIKGYFNQRYVANLLTLRPFRMQVSLFLQQNNKEDFELKPCSLVIHELQVNAFPFAVGLKTAYNLHMIKQFRCGPLIMQMRFESNKYLKYIMGFSHLIVQVIEGYCSPSLFIFYPSKQIRKMKSLTWLVAELKVALSWDLKSVNPCLGKYQLITTEVISIYIAH